MNKIYKLIWSKVKNCYVVASELAKAYTKSPDSGIIGQQFLERKVVLSLMKGCEDTILLSAKNSFVATSVVNGNYLFAEAKPKDFKITVAAIVKNEAKNVPQWVAAARSCADEIVVVDTGSTDDTVKQFADYGIECFHYDWNDDFASAKNYMISLCHGDWIVLLDGDEWFREGCDVRKAIAKHHNNPITKAIIADWICLDKDCNNAVIFSGGAVRAFRNQPDVRYFRKVHENLTIGLENFTFEPEFKMYHTGYSGSVNLSKHERNLRIMRTMFDFDNGKVEYPADWRYIEDTYAGLGQYDKALWAADKMISFGIQEHSAVAWITKFNVLFMMKTSMEEMKKQFEYCFKTVPSVSGFRFLASIYYFRNGQIEAGLDNYMEGLRMLMGPQDKVAMEHTYWRMYMPEASALASVVYLKHKQVEAAMYACKVCEQYCGQTDWTNRALTDIRKMMNCSDENLSGCIVDRVLSVFRFAKKSIAASAVASGVLFSLFGQSSNVYAATGSYEAGGGTVGQSQYAIAIGCCASVWSYNGRIGSVSIGYCAYSGGSDDVVIGYNASGKAGGSIVIGSNASYNPSASNYTSSIVIGQRASATGDNNLAMGRDSSVSNQNSIGIGAAVSVGSSYATALGNYATVGTSSSNSLALGYESVANTSSVVSFGHLSTDKKYNGSSYGSNLYRRLINVADGTDAHDVVTVGQMQSYVSANSGSYTLPAATSSVLGGVKVGSNITNSSGTISLTKANVTTALGYTPPTADTNTHYTTHLYAGSGTAANAATTNGNTKIALVDDSTVRNTLTIKGAGKTTVTSDAAGVITITSTDANTTYSNMTGATASAAGTAGLVPAPATGKQTAFLRGDGTWVVPTDTNTHYTTHLYAGSGTAANAATTNGNTKIALVDDSTVRNALTIKGTGATTVTSDANGIITINSTDNNTTYSAATQSANGLMTAADKKKLDGIASGANAYSLPTATDSVLGGIKVGSNLTNTDGTISLTKANVTAALGYTPPTTDTNTTYDSMSDSELTTGTATTARSISAKVISDYVIGKVSDEATTRATAISSETTARTNADTELGIRIDNVVSAYQSADTGLSNRIGSLDASTIKYDGVDHSLATLSGSNGTILCNIKGGAVNETSMEAINGSQLYAVKQDILGYANDIARNSENIRSMNASVTSALSSVAVSGLLVDTMDTSKADASLNNLTESGKRVLKQYAENAVQEYMAAQQGSNSAPMAPMTYAGNPNTLNITDAGNGSLHVGEGSYVNGTSSIAIGVGNQVNANNSGAFGDPSIINADESYVLGNDNTINTGATGSFIVGNDGVSDAKGGLLFGSNTKATVEAENGLVLGNNSEVSAKNAIALGSDSIANTENTLSIGNSELKRKIVNVADGDISQNSSEAVTGAQLFVTNEKVQKNTETIEKKADVDASNINTSDWAMKLGIGKVEDGNTDLVTGGTVYDAIKGMGNNDLVKDNGDSITIGATNNATVIDITNADGQGRAIKGVLTDEQDMFSAANVGYVNQVGNNIIKATNVALQKVDTKINKVGANAAALANLPTPTFEGEEKWAFAAGIGHYQDETAGAVGAFYKPTDNVIARVSGSFGNGDEMVGAGVAISLNKANTPVVSKAQLVRTINAQAGQIQQQANEIQQVKQENAAIRAENVNMQQVLLRMQERLDALEKK